MAITVISKFGQEISSLGQGSSKLGGYGAGTIAGPASYVAGGIPADVATDFGLSSEPDVVKIDVKQTSATRVHSAEWDGTAKKIVVYDAGTTNQSTGNLAAFTFMLSYHINET